MEGKGMDYRLIYAANREIGLYGLETLLAEGWPPIALLLADEGSAEYALEMRELFTIGPVFSYNELQDAQVLDSIRQLEPDYILSVHYPHIIPNEWLEIPKIGVLNLHPGYLPYNRGWHTPTWAILDDTPAGATLHWISKNDRSVDTGAVAYRRSTAKYPYDTAHTLYKRILKLEKEMLPEVFRLLRSGNPPHIAQSGPSTFHRKSDISKLERLNLDEKASIGDVLKLIRSLTTNKWSEAAYFEDGGARYGVRIEIRRIP